jgi:hypothetical protein
MSSSRETIANGAAGAAMLAASLGCFVLGVLAVAGDGSKAVARLLTFYRPTGPLSGVSTMAIVVWLAAWIASNRLWRGKTVAIGKVSGAAFVLLALGLLLTFPPIEDLLLGK